MVQYPHEQFKSTFIAKGDYMKIVILDRATLGADLDISIPLESDVVSYDASAPEQVADRIADADVIFVNKVRLTPENLRYAKSLKLICEAATGYDNINIDYCREHSIAVCNVPGYSTYSVAQITVSIVLCLINRMKEYTNFVLDGSYSAGNTANKLEPVFHELNSMTWGIVGYGNIGAHVADVARAFGCRVIAFKRHETNAVKCVDIDTLMKESDIISVHLPLSDQTRGIISADRIAMMKSNAVFVNAARGAVADEAALCRAAKEQKIYLGSDVYSTEPFKESSPYFGIKGQNNVCLTPHMAWGAYEARKRCFEEMIANMQSFLKGETRNRVDI